MAKRRKSTPLVASEATEVCRSCQTFTNFSKIQNEDFERRDLGLKTKVSSRILNFEIKNSHQNFQTRQVWKNSRDLETLA